MRLCFHSRACNLPILGQVHFQDFNSHYQDRLGFDSRGFVLANPMASKV